MKPEGDKTIEVDLPMVSPQVFERFHLWLYAGNILDPDESTRSVSWSELMDLYQFGDARGIPEMQNAVIDAIIEKQKIENSIPVTNFNKIYDQVQDDSPIRKLAVDFIAHLADFGLKVWHEKSMRETYKSSFLLDLAIELSQLSRAKKTKITSFESVKSNYYTQTPQSRSKNASTGS